MSQGLQLGIGLPIGVRSPLAEGCEGIIHDLT